MKTVRFRVLLLGLALLASGCRGPTQEERDNRRGLDAILTAITMKNARLLEESAKRAKARHDAGQLTDEQYQGMEAFIKKARTGDWSGAEKDAYEFRKKHPFVTEGH
ncbi:MAG TPA: hypothetical protein VG013_12815 [Gemmataceae bacterium]|jgi:hypothetical protein|nr:hypothetical protein [Gemmataceae bacterium]